MSVRGAAVHAVCVPTRVGRVGKACLGVCGAAVYPACVHTVGSGRAGHGGSSAWHRA